MIILFIIAITMMLVSARRPKLKNKYNALRDTYNYIARDVLLWMYYCLYIPEVGIPEYEYLLNLSAYGKFQDYEIKRLKTFEMKNITELEDCDLPLLRNIILSILNSKYASYEDEIEKIQDILKEFRDNRNMFAHSNEKYINIDSEAEFESRKQCFLEQSEKLIFSAQTMSGRIPEEEALEFFKEIMKKLEADWPKLKEEMSSIIDLEDDGDANTDNTLAFIEDTIQDKMPKIKATCVRGDETLHNMEMPQESESDAFDQLMSEVFIEDDM